MTDHRRMTSPGLRGHLVRFLAEESGAARHDRLLLIAGGGIVTALAVFMWVAEGFDGATDASGAIPVASGPAAPKLVSAGPVRALDPSPAPSEGAEGVPSQIFVASDYSETLSRGPDREAQLLEDELARVREAEAAAAAEAEVDETVQATPEAVEEGS